MIRMYNVPVAKDGIIQLPDDLHERLGGGKLHAVVFLERDGAVRLIPLTMTIDEVAGSLPPLPEGTSLDLDEEIEAAIEHALQEKYG